MGVWGLGGGVRFFPTGGGKGGGYPKNANLRLFRKNFANFKEKIANFLKSPLKIAKYTGKVTNLQISREKVAKLAILS
jgi:hypothetical protein